MHLGVIADQAENAAFFQVECGSWGLISRRCTKALKAIASNLLQRDLSWLLAHPQVHNCIIGVCGPVQKLVLCSFRLDMFYSSCCHVCGRQLIKEVSFLDILENTVAPCILPFFTERVWSLIYWQFTRQIMWQVDCLVTAMLLYISIGFALCAAAKWLPMTLTNCHVLAEYFTSMHVVLLELLLNWYYLTDSIRTILKNLQPAF